MRKGVVTILAVAIIGALGVYAKASKSTASSGNSNTSTIQPAVAGVSTNSNQQSSSDRGSSSSSGSLKDGTYTGQNEATPYGDVQIAVVVNGGKIADINFLQMPSDVGHSREVTAFSEPLLKQETLQKQSAHIDFVSGATQTSEAYQQSLQYALNQAA